MKALTVFLVALALIVTLGATSAQEQMKEQKKEAAPADPKAALAQSIERGKALFGDPGLGTSGLSCNSCHAEGGTKPGKMKETIIKEFDGTACKFPRHIAMANKVLTFDQMINFCIVNPLKGTALSWEDQRMTDLAAYIASVKKPAEKK